jgi:hypothetical protein
MGVDFIAYSNVRKEPVPEQFKNAYEIKGDLLDKFYEEMGKMDDYLYVDWEYCIVYWKTHDTIRYSSGRSYTGYADFNDLLEILGGYNIHLPPITGSELCPKDCEFYLKKLDTVKRYFVPADWKPDVNKDYRFEMDDYDYDIDVDIDTDDCEDIDTDCIKADRWFFCELYTALSVGSNNGVVSVG